MTETSRRTLILPELQQILKGFKMRAILFLLLLFPLVELALLIKIGAAIGVGWTLFWILITAIGGFYCLRIAGISTTWRIRERIQRGEMPEQEMQNGSLIAFAGIMLFIPGFLSDMVGLLLLIPSVRHGLLDVARRSMERRNLRRRAFADEADLSPEGRSQPPQIVEGEFIREDDPPSPEKNS